MSIFFFFSLRVSCFLIVQFSRFLCSLYTTKATFDCRYLTSKSVVFVDRTYAIIIRLPTNVKRFSEISLKSFKFLFCCVCIANYPLFTTICCVADFVTPDTIANSKKSPPFGELCYALLFMKSLELFNDFLAPFIIIGVGF